MVPGCFLILSQNTNAINVYEVVLRLFEFSISEVYFAFPNHIIRDIIA